MSLALALMLAAASPPAPALPQLDGLTPLAEAFQAYCVTPFPNETLFAATIAEAGSGFTRVEETGQPGQRYTDGTIMLNYVGVEGAPMGVPAPQCRMSAEVADGFSHREAAADISDLLDIETGKTTGRAGINKTIWNFEDAQGNTLRLFLASRPVPQDHGYAVSLTLMKLDQ